MRSSPEKRLIRETRKQVDILRKTDDNESVKILTDVVDMLLQKVEEQFNTILSYELVTEDILLKKGFVLPSKDGNST